MHSPGRRLCLQQQDVAKLWQEVLWRDWESKGETVREEERKRKRGNALLMSNPRPSRLLLLLFGGSQALQPEIVCHRLEFNINPQLIEHKQHKNLTHNPERPLGQIQEADTLKNADKLQMASTCQSAEAVIEVNLWWRCSYFTCNTHMTANLSHFIPKNLNVYHF